MNSSIVSNLTDLFQSTPNNIIKISLDKKIISGIQTDETCIVFGVKQKLPLEDLSGKYIVPETLELNNVLYKTDVIETDIPVMAGHCNAWNPPSATILSHRSKHRPLKGGITITSKNNNSQYTGTFGLICVDNETNALLGLTAAHIALGPQSFVFHSGDLTYNIVDKKIYQKTETDSNIETDVLGNVYKFYPVATGRDPVFGDEYINYIDAATFTLRKCSVNQTAIVDFDESFKQLNIPYNDPMPFASTEEIDSIYGTSINLYSAGRTTGPKGLLNCRLIIKGSSTISSKILFNGNEVNFSDIIEFGFTDNADNPVFGGDSGSVLIANFDGIFKIIGLVFAYSTKSGYACRIDRIASMLNISSWNGVPGSYLSYPPNFLTTTTNLFFRKIEDHRSNRWDIKHRDHWFAGFADFSGILNSISLPSDLTGVPISCAVDKTNQFVEHKMTYTLTSGSGAFVVDGLKNPTFRLVRDLTDVTDEQSPGDPWQTNYGASYTFNINAANNKVWIKTRPVTGTAYALNDGVINNGISNGSLIIKISDYINLSDFTLFPGNYTGILYYVSETDPKMFGKILTYSSIDGDEDGDGVANFDELDGFYNPVPGNPTNPFDPDTNKDGIPDKWCFENRFDPSADIAFEDPDGDGLINLAEYLLDTDPNAFNITDENLTGLYKVVTIPSNFNNFAVVEDDPNFFNEMILTGNFKRLFIHYFPTGTPALQSFIITPGSYNQIWGAPDVPIFSNNSNYFLKSGIGKISGGFIKMQNPFPTGYYMFEFDDLSKFWSYEPMPMTDTNNNGLPDVWEKYYGAFLTPKVTTLNPQIDYNNNNFTTLQDFRSGVPPVIKNTRPFDVPTIENPIFNNGRAGTVLFPDSSLTSILCPFVYITMKWGLDYTAESACDSDTEFEAYYLRSEGLNIGSHLYSEDPSLAPDEFYMYNNKIYKIDSTNTIIYTGSCTDLVGEQFPEGVGDPHFYIPTKDGVFMLWDDNKASSIGKKTLYMSNGSSFQIWYSITSFNPVNGGMVIDRVWFKEPGAAEQLFTAQQGGVYYKTGFLPSGGNYYLRAEAKNNSYIDFRCGLSMTGINDVSGLGGLVSLVYRRIDDASGRATNITGLDPDYSVGPFVDGWSMLGSPYGLTREYFEETNVNSIGIENMQTWVRKTGTNGEKIDFYMYDSGPFPNGIFDWDPLMENFSPSIAMTSADCIEIINNIPIKN